MKFSLRLLFLAVVTSACSFAGANSLYAQASILEANRNLVSSGPPARPPGGVKAGRLPVDATALIDFGNGQSVTATCHRGGFQRVGLRHDQMVDVAVQYSTAEAGKSVAVQPLDGGQVIAPARSLTVSADGSIHFKFRVGHAPGAYQIALRNGNRELGLQFWVRDDDHPRNNPPVINPFN